MTWVHKLVVAVALTAAVGPLAGCPKQTGPAVSAEVLAVDPKANFAEGVKLLQTPKKGVTDYAGAHNYFAKSVELNGSARAAFNAGWTAEVLGKPQDAVMYYKKAFDADPAYRAAMFSLARVYNQTGQGAASVDLYRGYLDTHADDIEVRTELIGALAAAKRFPEAEVQANEILLRDPKNAAAYRALSAMYYAKGEIGMSQLCNEKALQLNEGDASTYNNLAITDLLQGNEPSAIARFKTAIQLNSKHFEANTNLGYIALNSGDYALAKTSLQAAVDANPKSNEARLGLAAALRGTGDHTQAAALYDQIIAANPAMKEAYLNASVLHEFYTKDFTKAKAYLQSYVDKNPGAVTPSDPLFERMKRIDAAAAAEKARLAEIERKKKEAEEREKRNKALLESMTASVGKYNTAFKEQASCLPPEMVEEGLMVLEQAQMVVEAQDVEMAGDIQMLLEGYVPVWDEALAGCGGGAAPAPAEPAPQ
jgi:tetratricopeptide (TPR) repeat protein